MKIVIAGFAGSEITIMVVGEDNPVEPVKRLSVWHDKFVSTVEELLEKYDVEDITLVGHDDYIEGLGHQLAEAIDDDDLQINILIDESEKNND